MSRSGSSADPRIVSRREVALTVLAWAVGGALLALAAGQAWGRTAGSVLAPAQPVEGPATARALGVAALAAAAALPLLRGVGRRVVGLLGVVLGAAGATVVLARVPGAGGSAWPWLALVGAALVAACGAAVVVRAGRWPGGRSRFERAGERGDAVAGPAAAGGGVDGGRPASTREVWDALDRGEDPTLREPDGRG